MRDALSLLDQAVAYGGKTVNHVDLEVLLGAVPQELVEKLIKAVIAQDSPSALTVLASLLDQGHDLRAFCAEVVEYCRNLLVAAVVPAGDALHGLIEASEEDLNRLAADAKALIPEQLQEFLSIFTQAEDSLRFSAHPRFVMETAVIRATRLLCRQDSGTPRPLQPPSPSTPKPSTEPEGGQKSSPPIPPTSRQSIAPPSKPVAEVSPTSRSEKVKEAPSIAHDPLPTHTTDIKPPTPIPNPSHPFDTQSTLNWEAVQEAVAASHPNIAPFLEAGRFVGMEGGFVTIGFAKQSTVARTRLEKEENIQLLSKLCAQQLGHHTRVRIIELSEIHPPGPTMAQVRAAKEQEHRLVLFERAKANPTVKQALEIFGAELAEVRTVPQKEVNQ